MTQRLNTHRYRSPLGFLPKSRLSFLVLLVALPITFFAADFFGPAPRVWLFVVNFGMLFFIVAPWHHLVPAVRSFGMKRAAEQLGLSYRWRENIGWLPPNYRDRSCGAEDNYFNVLRGRVGGVSVLVFDSRMERTTWSTDSEGSQKSHTSTRSKYSIVQLQGQRKLPRLLLGSRGLTSHRSLPIAGTKYHLHLPDKYDRQRAARLITDRLVELLAANPGLAIEVDGPKVTVYDDKSWTNRRRTPGNLPAFLEDVLGLAELLEAGLEEVEPRTRFSLDAAQASLARSSGVYVNDRLRSIHAIKRSFGVQESCAAFGLIWTVMGLFLFMFFFETPGPKGDTWHLRAVFFCLFMLIGVGLMLPWTLRKLFGPRGGMLKEPMVTVSGLVHLPGSTLAVRFRQRHSGPDSSRAAGVQLKLVLKDDQETVWSTEQKLSGSTVNPGGSMQLDCSFAIPQSVSADSLDAPSWSIEAMTEVDGQQQYSGTFWLPGEWLGRELAIPGILLGLSWGLWIGFGATVTLGEYLLGDLPGWLFGIAALFATGGPILGGILGYKISRVVARWPVIRPCAAVFGRLNVFLQFFLSALIVGLSLLAVTLTWSEIAAPEADGGRNQVPRQSITREERGQV